MTLQIRYSHLILNCLEHFPFASIDMVQQHRMVFISLSFPLIHTVFLTCTCTIRQSNQAVLVTLYLTPATMFVRVSINVLKTEYDKNYGYYVSGHAGTLSCHQYIPSVASQSSQCITCLLSKEYKVSPDDEPLLGDAAQFVIMPPLQFELASVPSESGITNDIRKGQARNQRELMTHAYWEFLLRLKILLPPGSMGTMNLCVLAARILRDVRCHCCRFSRDF
ncbi:hypothetical protein T07_14964 [Trichinella nelsoni]|uniref:Uncharacterized protein n=1 Tax=Trichinella nelsoni TaxID=6336 RepID=A0A0V0RI71_9BILA|nr:hypothetical protein T07_14964 [Trichinella nelsoni]